MSNRKTPARPRSAQITDRLVLERTIASAGRGPIRGYLEVDNQTGAPITVPDACDSWLIVGLTNEQVPFTPVEGGVACKPGRLPVGVSRTPISITTMYTDCHQGQSRASKTPRCLGTHHDQMPQLPAGRYVTAVFSTTRPVLPQPSAVTVTLVD